MDKSIRSHSVCEKKPLLAIVMAMVLAIVSSVIVGTLAFYMATNNNLSIANKIWDKKWNTKQVEE